MYELFESDSWIVCIVFLIIVFFGGIVLINLFLAAIFQANIWKRSHYSPPDDGIDGIDCVDCTPTPCQ